MRLRSFLLLSLTTGTPAFAAAGQEDARLEIGGAASTEGASGSAAASETTTADEEADGSSVRLHLTGGVARAFGGYQESELSWGGAVYGAAEWGPSAVWGIQLEAGFVGLTSGDGAAPVGVAALDGANGLQVGLGLRVRPFAPPKPVVSGGGLWLSAAGGFSVTGGGVYPQFDAFLGYDFYLSRALGVGPTVGYVHVFDTAAGPREGDAHVGIAGLHVTFDFVSTPRRAPVVVDSDGDGIPDERDRCPNEPEDRDGFEDEDGCPDPDNDGDGVPDERDRCPNEPEDKDGFEDEDGCPDLDNDRDDIPDAEDRCPNEPEDRDGFEDEDGCPDLDNDGDGIPDARDLCPNEPETLNGFSDNDGCPDEEHVRVVGDKIELDQKIHFWSDSAVIRALSYPVLNKLAEFLKAHPEYVHVDIEGHADERGPDDLNQRLSEARAESVKKFLIQKGVDASRLSSAGFGSTRPLVEGKSEHAWFMNRRVEFIVTRERLERSGSTSSGRAPNGASSDAPAGGASAGDTPAGDAPRSNETSEKEQAP